MDRQSRIVIVLVWMDVVGAIVVVAHGSASGLGPAADAHSGLPSPCEPAQPLTACSLPQIAHGKLLLWLKKMMIVEGESWSALGSGSVGAADWAEVG